MKLLLINAFKGLRKKKIQMFGIVMMVMLSTAVYVGMNSAIDRLEDRYYNYLEEQNVEDLSFGVNIDYAKITIAELDNISKNYLSNMTIEETIIISSYRQFLNAPTYNLQMIYSVKPIFDKYGVTAYLEKKAIDSLVPKYDFSYELEQSKTVTQKNNLLKVMVYNRDNKINKTYLIEGNYPKKSNEITMLPSYAKKNNLVIGDTYKIGDNEYKIVGFTYSPDYIYPLISFSMPIFDEKNNNIIFMLEEDYNKVIGVVDNSYALKYNYETDRQFEFNKDNSNSGVFKIFNDESKLLMMDVNTFTRIGRISALQMEFSSDRLFADYFMYLLLSISVLIILVITKKRIDDERLQIGVLKSLGYNRFSIATSYLVYPIIGSLIGGLLGYMIGIAIHKPMASILLSFYNVPLAKYAINLHYLGIAILTPMISLSILSYLIALFMLRKKPLDLLKEGSNLKVNIFSKLFTKLTSLLPFNYRFKYSLAFRSIGKLLIVSITSFSTGLLIILVLIGSNLFNNVIEKSFDGIKYEYMVTINGIDTKLKDESKTEDYILSVNLPLTKIIDKNNKEHKVEDDTNISITGVDINASFVEILNSENKNTIDLLNDQNNIIVNESTKKLLGLEIGDKLLFEYNDLKFEYIVAGFSSEYMGYSGYTSRSSLSSKCGFATSVYTAIYSNDKKYSDISLLDKTESEKIYNVTSLKDLKANIQKQLDRFNGSIYIVILFASVMALIIISVIANIVVEENKKTISLMKVMGYKNKRISNIVLNIYTPFVVVSYLLSIPVMIEILKKIIDALTGDIEMTIPIAISPLLAGLGLVGLVAAYYIAIALSKRVLNKIPLAIALKRE